MNKFKVKCQFKKVKSKIDYEVPKKTEYEIIEDMDENIYAKLYIDGDKNNHNKENVIILNVTSIEDIIKR